MSFFNPELYHKFDVFSKIGGVTWTVYDSYNYWSLLTGNDEYVFYQKSVGISFDCIRRFMCLRTEILIGSQSFFKFRNFHIRISFDDIFTR